MTAEGLKITAPDVNTEKVGKDEEDPKKKKKNGKEEPPKSEFPPVPFHSLFRFASLSDRILIFISMLAAATTGIAMPVMLVLFGDLTNAFVYNDLSKQNFTGTNISVPFNYSSGDLADTIATFGLGVTGIGIVLLVMGYIFVTCMNITAENQVYRIRSLFLSSILKQDIGWYDTKTSNDFASRMTEDLNKIQDGIGEKIGMFMFCFVAFLSNIINAFIHGWELTLVIMAAMPVLTISMGILAKVQTSLTANELTAYGLAGTVAEQALGAVRTVHAFGGEKSEIALYDKNLIQARKAGMKRSLVTGIGAGTTWFIIYASYALAFWYGVKLILDGYEGSSNYDPSSLVVVFFSVLSGAMQIGQAAPYMEAFAMARGAAANIFNIIDRQPPIDSSSKDGKKPDKLTGEISFESVRFNYPARPDVKILQGLSLKVKAGETIALVGSSGCGKSTCIQLIQRFYDPIQGEVKLDGNNIRDLNIGWLRDSIGVVGQEPVLFGTTIGENIRYGRDNVTDEEVRNAANMANAHDFIMKLPKRYDTLVGERGTQLSGGQKQRVAIARALVRNPRILLLDEATSALDNQSESVVQRALDKAREGRTTIIVAHRLSTIRGASKIFVLDKGVVQEEGKHSELMTKRGLYYQLVKAQKGDEDTEDEELDDQPPSYDEIENEDFDSRQSFRKGRNLDEISKTVAVAEDSDLPEVSIFQIMRYNAKEWPYILTGIIGASVVGLSIPAYAVLFGEVMGILSDGDAEEARRKSIFYAILFLIAGTVTGIAAFFQSYMFGLAGEFLTSRLRVMTFTAMLKQEMGWFDQESNSSGALCARLSGDASSVQGATGSRLGVLFQSVATLVVCVGLAMYFQWKLGMVTLLFVPLVLVATYFQAKIIMGQNAVEKKSIEVSSKIAMEAISNVRTVASLRREEKFHNMYMESLNKPHVAAKKRSHIRGLVFGFAQSIPMFGYATCMYYGGYLVENEGLDYSIVFKVSEALIFGTMMVGQTVAFAPNYNKAKVAAAKIIELLNRKPLIDTSPTTGTSLKTCKGQVNYQNVDFSYPTRKDVQVLKSLCLQVKPGQTVALVGHSGCGKSTCIQLLERFYDPAAGQVRLDGENIAPVNVPNLRSQLGIVSQEPSLFNRTIAENIAYGDNSRKVPMEEIIAAARKANIHNFIVSLPLGYETLVGDKGTQLSGGQKQRVAIARALVRNPKILLLDEATSALDSESEKVVQEALDLARLGRTCITIAHRLSTIQNADSIVVISHGIVAEQGTHQELIELGGLYYELYTMQGGVSGKKPGNEISRL